MIALPSFKRLAFCLLGFQIAAGWTAGQILGGPGGATSTAGTMSPGDDLSGLNPYLIPGAAGKQLGLSVVGHFNNDDWLDTIVMVDNQPVILSGRDIYLSFDAPLTSAISMDTFPAGGPDGQDALMFTDGNGLHIGWWDFTAKAFVKNVVDSGAWAGASDVQVSDVDGTGRVDVLGISANRQALLILAASSGSQTPSFTPLSSIQTTTELHGFSVLEWDGVGTPEVALLVDEALEIRELTGELIQQWSGLPTGGWLATMKQGYLPNDRLSWVTPTGVNGVTGEPLQMVYTVDMFGIDIPLDTSSTFVTSVKGVDWDSDGDDDIVAGYGISHDVVVLINGRNPIDLTGPSFGALSTSYLLPVGPAATSNLNQVANVVVGDFDNDGDADAAIAVASTGEFRIATNVTDVESNNAPVIKNLGYRVISGSPTGELKFTVDQPKGVLPQSVYLQIIQWHQRDLSGASQPVPVAADTFEIIRWPAEIKIDVQEVGQFFSSIYYLEMRFGESTGVGQPVIYGEASLGGFTLSPITVAELAKTIDSGPPVVVIPVGDLIFDPGGVGLLGGGYIPNLKVPPTEGLNYQ
ncbi:MAG: hypothetical protein ACI87A_002394 [Planctomycetota bacterium]|jgi:hypothetical protein